MDQKSRVHQASAFVVGNGCADFTAVAAHDVACDVCRTVDMSCFKKLVCLGIGNFGSVRSIVV